MSRIARVLHVHLLALLLIISGCALLHQDTRPEQKIRVLLDSDANNELDDQHAIAYMLFSGDRFTVEGVTVNRTNSGGDIDAQLTEAQRVVTLSGLDGQMPVLKGADGSFTEIAPQVAAATFDGSEAVRFIIDRAHAPGGRLVLIPVGKLTNIALALKKDPSIASKVRIVWLGSNYPEPGEYNQINDEPALQYLLDLPSVEFEVALVRYGQPSGTDAVRVTLQEMRARMPGKGPRVDTPVTGRHGGEFRTFGDYSINLFEHIELHGNPPSRALYDMAAVAIVKNPSWATAKRMPAPQLVNGKWVERPANPRTITMWENFARAQILADFFQVMNAPRVAGAPRVPVRTQALVLPPWVFSSYTQEAIIAR